MNIDQLDLNLLTVFQAIYAERSISKAAKRLGVTQPAVSKSLKKLRAFTGDTLFYASGQGVTPTRTATALAIPIHHALQTVEEGLANLRNFDPMTSSRTFRIGVNDLVNPLLVPALVRVVSKEAPNVLLQFVQQSPDGPKEALVRGDLDTCFLPGFLVDENLVSARVWTESFVLVASKSHPIARDNVLTVEKFKSLRFTTQTHAKNLSRYVDDIFKQVGISRTTSTYVSDIQSVYALVSVSDQVAVVGRNTLSFYNSDDSLVSFDLPVTLPNIEAHTAWTKQSDSDDGHKWLRTHIISILQGAAEMFEES